jgi:hypothetical protein
VIPPRSDSASRTLAYEQMIARRAKSAPEAEESKPAEPAIPPFETMATPAPQAPADDVTAAHAAPAMPSTSGQVADTNQAVPPLPGEGSAHPHADMPPLPGGQSETYGDVPPMPGEGGEAYGEAQPMPAQDGTDPWGAEPPGSDPWGQQEAGTYPAEQTEEWVQVVISGAAMRASASEDAPMLFAFPYGRNLRVVSRYEGWLEVTDPQSSATGWMQTHYLAPTGSVRPGYGPDETAYEEPRERRGLFRRGGFADMIQRAFGGH